MDSLQTKIIAKTVVLWSGQLLILRRSLSDEKGPGMWDLPGGTVDDGEATDAAASRELFEEAGIKTTADQLNLVYTTTGMFENGNRCWLFYTLELSDATEVILSEEHSEFQWLPLKEAIHISFFQTQERALSYLVQYTQ